MSELSAALVLRLGRPEERQLLEDLQRRSSLINEAYRDALLANPGAIHLPLQQLQDAQVQVAELAGQVVGFTAVLPSASQACDLDGLFVEPDRWKRGIGRALAQNAFALARAQGRVAMDVFANPYAEGFYEKLGFVRTGIVQTQFGIAGKMRRELA